MKTYRITTSADPDASTSRDDVFDVDADEFHISSRGGVRVTRFDTAPPVGLLARWARTFRPARENVAWVPHDSLISCRLIGETEPPAPDPASATTIQGPVPTSSETLRARARRDVRITDS